jgi:hypothetical protein
MIQIEKLAKALELLSPNGNFTLSGDTYADINWIDDNVDKPTESAVNTKITEIESAEPMDNLRRVRNKKLAETDWVVIKEREEGGSVSNFADWKTYRQALRDITDSATSLDDVTWPEKPE